MFLKEFVLVLGIISNNFTQVKEGMIESTAYPHWQIAISKSVRRLPKNTILIAYAEIGKLQ